MNNDELQLFDRGYNEGFFFAAQAVASAVLRLIDNHPSWMLKTSETQARAEIKIKTRRILQKRGLLPYGYQVLTGKAEDVKIDFNLDY